MQIVVRFLVGGAIVSAFSLIADLFKPKSFAGLFGGAPSVALATLLLTISKDGKGYAAIEARSMALGAAAFVLCACVMARLFLRRRARPRVAIAASVSV
jgi:uncharacterized protein DUF3147